MISSIAKVGLAAAVVAGLALGASGLARNGAAPATSQHGRAVPPDVLEECGEGAYGHADSGGVPNIPGVGALKRIPEFNDCQRFLDVRRGRPAFRGQPLTGEQDDLSYAELYAIYATPKLPNLADTIVSLTDSAKKKDVAVQSVAVVAAVIYSFGGTYQRLGIGPGFNCLYVFGLAGSLQAAMVQAPNDPKCPDPVDTTAITMGQAKRLLVRRTTVDGLLPEDYPPVARWDWDDDRDQHYIGVRCGEAWCEIGDSSFRPSPTNFDEPGASRERRRVRLVKGWYDLQHLVIHVPAGQGRWKGRDVIKGVAFPHESLGTYQPGDFQATWRPAARIVWWAHHDNHNPNEKLYKFKMNFDRVVEAAAERGVRVNASGSWISICMGSKNQCKIPATAKLPANCGNNGADRWWAMIKGDDSSTVYRCVKRMDHGIPNIPGAVRWRWTDDDEKVWVKCGNGCCEVDP